MIKLSSVIFPGGVHVAGQTRYEIHGEGWDLSVVPEGLLVRCPAGKTHWIPAAKAESGEVVEESVAPVVAIARKR